jgi:hypothetical protein
MAKTGWFPPGQSDEEREQQVTVSILGLRAFAPGDEVEGLLAGMAMAQFHGPTAAVAAAPLWRVLPAGDGLGAAVRVCPSLPEIIG